MGEGPYRTPPKGDEEFDPKKHVKVDEKSWIRKSAVESDQAAEREAERRNSVIKEPNWFFRLFGKTNKEDFHSVLHEEALEKDLEGLNHTTDFLHSHASPDPSKFISGTYNGYQIKLRNDILGPSAEINGTLTTEEEANKIWKKLNSLLTQRNKNRNKLKKVNDEMGIKRPVLEVLGTTRQKPNRELPEATQPKQLPEKTEDNE